MPELAARGTRGVVDLPAEAPSIDAAVVRGGEEAAAAFGIPVATVWTRLHHARKELRATLMEGE